MKTNEIIRKSPKNRPTVSKTTQPRPGGAFWKDDQWRILLFSHKDVGLVFCYYEII